MSTEQLTGNGSRTTGADDSSLEARLASLERKLVEAYDDLWNSFVDPRTPLFDGDCGPWLPLGGQLQQPGATAPAFTTEVEHREIRAQCRALAVSNEFAINAHENRVSYIVGAGHTYRASPKKNAPRDADGLAAQVQEVIDRFIQVNQWQRRQQELVLRCDRDGEAFLRFFTSRDGTTKVRFVEPSQISTPPEFAGDVADSFGIRTDRDDVETVLGYYIDGQLVDADEVQHRKANVDLNVKRGLPLFFPVRKNLGRAEKLLRNMSVVSEIQSAIALIRKHRNGTRTAIQQFIQQQADATVTQSATGRTSIFKRYAPGTILDAHGDVDYEFPTAGLDVGKFVAVLQAELRAIASRLVMPEFMLSSDASNANYASTMVAETPAVRMFERLQTQQVEDDRAVFCRVIRNACEAGALPEAAATDVEIQIEPPTLAMRDRAQEAQIYKLQHESGILSPQTWSILSGLDYDQEQANLRAAQLTPSHDERHSRPGTSVPALAEWDEWKHPRLGGPPNAGQFAKKGTGTIATGAHQPAGFQDPPKEKAPSAKENPKEALTTVPRPTMPAEGTAEHQHREETLKDVEKKLKFAPNVNKAAKKRITDTLAIMYDMGEGSASRALVIAVSHQEKPIEVKLNSKSPAANPNIVYGFDPKRSATLFLNRDQSLGAEATMKNSPAEKPPADWRGDVIVMAHELGHVLDRLRLTDALYFDGKHWKAPYYGAREVVGANPLLENVIRAELNEHSVRHDPKQEVPPRPSYSGVAYNAQTWVADEEIDRLNRFLEPLKKRLPEGLVTRVPENQYRKNP